MAMGRSASVLKQFQTLFQVGAVGGLTDGQLLDRFVQKRDEAAFAALVERHGPMVWRVCRSRLGDRHDADDAFQATFLVLVKQAHSIRNSETVAGWLFGVAARVSVKALAAARRRTLAEQKIAMASTGVVEPHDPAPWAELYQELDGLPEKYRLPLVLCHLEGLTYEQAAARLHCPVRTVQTRLARGRERLRSRLVRRGLTPSAALLGTVVSPQTVSLEVPVLLKEATVQVAMRLANIKGAAVGASPAAVTLIREVSRAMFLAKINLTVKLLVLIGIIGAGAWIAWIKTNPRGLEPAARASAPVEEITAPPPWDQADPGKPDERYHMTGFVRVEKTGEPVAGVKVQALLGGKDLQDHAREAVTDADGRYSISLPEGNANAFLLNLPPGYWQPDPMKVRQSFAVTPGNPICRNDYSVRPGTVWAFRLSRGPKQEPVRAGTVVAAAYGTRPQTDDKGLARVTLPTEAGNTTMWLLANHKNEPMLTLTVRWDPAFRPDAVKNVKRLEDPGKPARFELTDDAGKSATISGPVDPVVTAGRLVISGSLPDGAARATGTLKGTVLDQDGRPVNDANVTIFFSFRQGGTISDRDEHHVRTDAQGRYAIPAIPRESYEGDVTKLTLVVYKDGYAGFDSPEFNFRRGGDGTQVVAPIRLQPGLAVSGTVVDPEGRPVAGAEIWSMKGWATGMRKYRSGPGGKFTIPDLTKGVTPISFTFGKLSANAKYVVDGKGELKVQLRPTKPLPEVAARPDPVVPLKVGQLAPEWRVCEWTDGRSRTLADSRDKVVFLDFWGIWCGPCVKSLPVVDRLRAKYEPKGVVFASIHTPGDTLANIRKVFDLEHLSLVSTVDDGADDDPGGGTTARAYGVRGYPTHFLIDKSGKIAFRSDDPANQAARNAVIKRLGIDTTRMTPEKANQLMEAFLGEAIEQALNLP